LGLSAQLYCPQDTCPVQGEFSMQKPEGSVDKTNDARGTEQDRTEGSERRRRAAPTVRRRELAAHVDARAGCGEGQRGEGRFG